MTRAEQFFYDNAGYSVRADETIEQGKQRTARELAHAEKQAESMGWTFDWEPDIDADPMDWDGDGPMGDEAFGCILRDANGKVLDSLWGIWDPDKGNYQRAVQAEMAYEAITSQNREFAESAALNHMLVTA
jgi:hypothetical protein